MEPDPHSEETAVKSGTSGAWPEPELDFGSEVLRPWPGRPFVLQLFYARIEGRRECVGLFIGSFEKADGQGIFDGSDGTSPHPIGAGLARVTTDLQRGFSLRKLVARERERDRLARMELEPQELRDADLLAAANAYLAAHPEAADEPTWRDLLAALPEDARREALARRAAPATAPRVGRAGRPPLTDYHFARVAAVYVDAHTVGHNTAEAVAAAFKRKPKTAINWILEARRRGFLTASPGAGRSGGQLTDQARRVLKEGATER